ncbi:MAG: DNA polymerase III subunit delta' [Alphaproteobacteria bacterium]|nr:DNA polymerase III subunit delta' [Alphaproteobacteria bacterium]
MAAADEAERMLPRQNPDLAGQEQAERVLLDAYRSGRLPHAWLISGPRGIGKATLAYRFARFVLSETSGGAGGGPGGGLFGAPLPPESMAVAATSPIFRKVAAGSHPDLFIVERRYDEKAGRLKTEIVVPDVQGLGNFLHLTPAEGGWRVVVVDSADDMNRHAANAILKLIEEPPKRSLILLVSHAPGGLLPTIRSRCRKLVLKPLDETTLSELLARHRPELDVDERRVLARLAEGSIGRALDLSDAGGVELYRELIELLGSLPRLNAGDVHALADRLGRRGQEQAFTTLAELLTWWLSRALAASAAGKAPADVIEGDGGLALRLMAGRSGTQRSGGAGLDRWLDLWDKLTRLIVRAEGANLDRKQVILNAMLGLEAAARH